MSEVLINILVDKKFHESYIYTMLGVGVEFFRVMTNLVYNVSQSERKTKYTVKPYLLGFIVSLGILIVTNFGTNYFMIPIVLGGAYFLVFIYMYSNMKKLLDIHIEVKMLKMLLLTLPFSIVYFIDVASLGTALNLFVISTFGIYFLYVIWIEVKKKVIYE